VAVVRLTVRRDGLKRLRLERGLSRETLAAAAGVNGRTIEAMELGRNLPRPSTIRKVASALDVAIEDISEVVEL